MGPYKELAHTVVDNFGKVFKVEKDLVTLGAYFKLCFDKLLEIGHCHLVLGIVLFIRRLLVPRVALFKPFWVI